MKFSRTAAMITTAAMLLTPAFSLNAFAEEETGIINAESVFEEFNSNDVNGAVLLNLPENCIAEVKITAYTPEADFLYYSGSYSSADSSVFSFGIEGYDCSKNLDGAIVDGREYVMELVVTDTALELTSGVYTDTFTVPDGDINLYTWVDFNYNISIVELDTEEVYSITEDEDGTKNITFYVTEPYILGDVDENGEINGVDASKVLAEYAVTSTGGEATLTEVQFKAADVNLDGIINGVDASKILAYYAELATGGTPSW